jgi:hypothetical protein
MEQSNSITLSTGTKVPKVQHLSDKQLWKLVLIPIEDRMPKDLINYLNDVKSEFDKRPIKLKPIMN